jgi:diphthamide synthase (EF-2-diphthine--ammonia ligase)
VACVDARVLDRTFVGRKWDAEMIADLPKGVDPCGENGEFHTCATAGPMFRQRLRLVAGRQVDRPPLIYMSYSLR